LADNNKNDNTTIIAGIVVVVVLVIGIMAWSSHRNNPTNIEPAAGNSQIEKNLNSPTR
jgi:hypothetical protein